MGRGNDYSSKEESYRITFERQNFITCYGARLRAFFFVTSRIIGSVWLGSSVRVMIPVFGLGLGLQTQNWPRTDRLKKGRTGHFISVTLLFCLRYGKKGDVVCRWRYGMFRDVSIHLVTFLCSRHVPVFPSLVLSVVRAFSAVSEFHRCLVFP